MEETTKRGPFGMRAGRSGVEAPCTPRPSVLLFAAMPLPSSSRGSNREPVERAGTPSGALLFASPRRTRLVVVGSTAYLGAAALRSVEAQGTRAWGATAIALGVAWAASGHEKRRCVAEWGLALALASFGAPEAEGWVAALGFAGGAMAAIAAAFALALVEAPSSMVRPSKPSLVFGVGVLGALLLAGLSARVLRAAGGHGLFAAQAGVFALTSCTLAGAFLIGQAWDTARVRRLELGVGARMHAAAGLGGAAAGAAWGVGFAGFGAAEPIARVALAFGSLLMCHVALRGDPVDLARASRRAVALTVVGGPVLMLGAAAAEGRGADAASVVAIFGVLALAIGAAASWIEEPLRPARGAWLDAVAAAHDALLRTDADEAVREALVALRAPAGLSAESPELWTFDPIHVTTVDAAGYAHGSVGTLPEGMVAAAASEPEAILRAEVLEALSVRRPELRPFARWMDDRGAMLVTVIARAGEAEGLLVLPRGRRGEALSLEEARAIKRLADALAALCHARAALGRCLARERAATEGREAADAALGRANIELERRAAAHTLAAERLARPATVGIYSAAARLAFDAIEGTVAAGRTLFVHAPGGVDAVPYVARAHLAGPRGGRRSWSWKGRRAVSTTRSVGGISARRRWRWRTVGSSCSSTRRPFLSRSSGPSRARTRSGWRRGGARSTSRSRRRAARRWRSSRCRTRARASIHSSPPGCATPGRPTSRACAIGPKTCGRS